MRPVLVILAGFALIALLLGWTRWLSDRRWAAAGHLALGLGATALTAWLWPLGLHLETYEPHRPGQPVAELFLEQTASSRFRASLTRLPSGRMQVFELAGEQWQIEARTMTWTGRAAELGIGPSHRLERLSSRSASAAVGVDVIQSAFALAARDRGADLWSRAQGGPVWDRVLEAGFAASPWQPMANGARFELRIGPTGMQANPLNGAALASLGTAR
jgi:hypothetical protein